MVLLNSINIVCYITGGCKHAIAFLMWIHRRSEDPAPTSVECYWKKSKLSSVGSTLKFVKSSDIFPVKNNNSRTNMDFSASFLSDVVEHGKNDNSNTNSTLLKYYKGIQCFDNLSLHNLSYWFIETKGRAFSSEDFLEFCEQHMAHDLCVDAEEKTRLQSSSSLWHQLRFARITASKLYEASRCKTIDGSLVESIFGAKIKDTPLMKRGRVLEEQVVKVVEKITGKTFTNVGLILSGSSPIIGASPDAISTDHVMEVKCPSTITAVSRYVSEHGMLTPKCLCQIQLQMHMTGKMEGLFCVAHPDFESSQNVDIYNVHYDGQYIKTIIDQAISFWKLAIYPKLMQKDV